MTCGIYMITRTDTGERYIGHSRCVENRVRSHKNEKFKGICFTWQLLEKFEFPVELRTVKAREWDWCDKIQPELNKLKPVMQLGRKGWANNGKHVVFDKYRPTTCCLPYLRKVS